MRWLAKVGFQREREFKHDTGGISTAYVNRIRKKARKYQHRIAQRSNDRLTTERVGRVISLIGKEVGVLVQRANGDQREKFVSAHDLRRGCALRLINADVSAETLKIVMRHKNFATTEKHYGAFRSAQSAFNEIAETLSNADSASFVGGLTGGIERTPELNAEELSKLKSLLDSL